MPFSWRAFCLTLALCLFSTLAPSDRAGAQTVAERAILTIRGDIGHKDATGAATFTLQALQALPQHDITTATPWYPRAVTFTGPLLRDVLAAIEARGTAITATALDDFVTEIPIADSQNYDVVLALKIDGKLLSVREKGPLFIIYPFDSEPSLRSKMIYDRCAWQLKSMTIH